MKKLELQPEQAAVISAYQRIAAILRVESKQLHDMYGQEGPSAFLGRHVDDINREAKEFIESCARAIIIPKPEVVLASPGQEVPRR